VGTINEQDQLTRVRTWIDNPVLGDTEVDTSFGSYRDFGGVAFPSHIVRTQGGHRVLDLTVGEVKWNTAVNISVPEVIAKVPVPPVTVTAEKLADGVFYLRGGTHHSVAIELRKHVVLVEAPLNEQRSQAVIDKVKELIPGKPIKYLINTHAHFDHSGGLRTYVAEGATIVTHRDNVPYYKKAWAQAHSINPDRQSQAHRVAKFEAFGGKHVLTDGQRRIEIHSIVGNTHNDAFALVYLPAEKVLIEADAYTPLAANAAAPTSVSPYALNLLDNVEKLKLDVALIAALHGPGVVRLDDLRAFVGKRVASR
jgi:glyoxylase-like metal-dependent hydrolase (beta-lactamase superfamily II)